MHGAGQKISGRIVWLKSYRRNSKSQNEKSCQDILTAFFNYGAGERNRTLDLLITSELLYQLSYSGNRALDPKL
jgi:hypothetical protein